MFFNLTVHDLVYAAIAAIIITWVLKGLSRMFMIVVTRSTEFGYRPKDLDIITKKCCGMFPNEILRFNGLLVRRGMTVRARTTENKTIEGRFIGINMENIVCIITCEHVVAQELKRIADIQLLTQG